MSEVMDVPNLHISSLLPEGWVPEGAAVFLLARRREDGSWESVVPEFSIAGMGDSLEDAARNALELLDDYLLVCAREGKTFEDACRPIGMRSRVGMLRDLVVSLVRNHRRRGGHHDGRGSERFRVPLRLVGVH